MKDDIYKAVMAFIHCRQNEHVDSEISSFPNLQSSRPCQSTDSTFSTMSSNFNGLRPPVSAERAEDSAEGQSRLDHDAAHIIVVSNNMIDAAQPDNPTDEARFMDKAPTNQMLDGSQPKDLFDDHIHELESGKKSADSSLE